MQKGKFKVSPLVIAMLPQELQCQLYSYSLTGYIYRSVAQSTVQENPSNPVQARMDKAQRLHPSGTQPVCNMTGSESREPTSYCEILVSRNNLSPAP